MFLFLAYCLSQGALFLRGLLYSLHCLSGGGPGKLRMGARYRGLAPQPVAATQQSPGELHAGGWRPGALGSAMGPDSPKGC